MLLHPFLEGGISKFTVHQGAVTALAATPDFKMLFSASSDGSIFLFNISEERINPDIPLQQEEVQSEPARIMDQELSAIVLVSQQEMEQWLLKQNKLKSDLE